MRVSFRALRKQSAISAALLISSFLSSKELIASLLTETYSLAKIGKEGYSDLLRVTSRIYDGKILGMKLSAGSPRCFLSSGHIVI